MARGSSSKPADIPVRATYPRQLIVYNTGSWEPLSDSTEDNRKKLFSTEYLAVSYRQSDFPDPPHRAKLEEAVRYICEIRRLTAYWLNFACTGISQEEKNQDLYRIADVFRCAKETIIMLPNIDGWKSWGSRVWTYPEALLSKKLLCREGQKMVREISLFEIDNLAYGDNEKEHRLAALYSTEGKDFAKFHARIEDLCLAIWSRNCGPGESPSSASSSQLTALPGERVYALMRFFQIRIKPDPNETEEEAFKRLMEVNELKYNISPWDAINTGAEFIIYDTSRLEKEGDAIETIENLQYIAAAKYNDNQCAVKTACEVGTRVATLKSIFEWLEQNSSSTSEDEGKRRVFWLYGLAGIGKSTIAKTVAEHCDEKNILGATFFCSHFNGECSNKFNILTTISYQLCLHNEAFLDVVKNALSHNKDLSRANLETQLKKFIVEPLQAVTQPARYVVIIDALDECSDDSSISDLLRALDKYIDELSPLKFIVTSRPENNIRRGFLSLDLSAHLNKQNLGNIPSSEVNMDIRIYLKKELRLISFGLGESWPSDQDIEEIAVRSGGLFIFASTTVRFLDDQKFNDPVGQLKRLLTSTKPQTLSNTSPHATLDKLYLTILEEKFKKPDKSLLARLHRAFKILIAAGEPLTINQLEAFMPEIHTTLRDLHSLIFIPEKRRYSSHTEESTDTVHGDRVERVEKDNHYVRFIHPSFRDFLLDRKRCTNRFLIKLQSKVTLQCCADGILHLLEGETEIRHLLDSEEWSEVTWSRFFKNSKVLFDDDEEEKALKYASRRLEDFFKYNIDTGVIIPGIRRACNWMDAKAIPFKVAEILSEGTTHQIQHCTSCKLKSRLGDTNTSSFPNIRRLNVGSDISSLFEFLSELDFIIGNSIYEFTRMRKNMKVFLSTLRTKPSPENISRALCCILLIRHRRRRARVT